MTNPHKIPTYNIPHHRLNTITVVSTPSGLGQHWPPGRIMSSIVLKSITPCVALRKGSKVCVFELSPPPSPFPPPCPLSPQTITRHSLPNIMVTHHLHFYSNPKPILINDREIRTHCFIPLPHTPHNLPQSSPPLASSNPYPNPITMY